MTTRWRAFPYDSTAYRYTRAALEARWPGLHAGDGEPLPADPKVLAAWALLHAGEFEDAMRAGLAAGDAGITVANKAQALHATYLETSEAAKLAKYDAVAARAQAQIGAEPRNPNAHFWLAYALGRSGQSISITRALAQGLSAKVKAALETTIALAPTHADAHVALGTYHAEVIDKLGGLLGRTQGASKEAGLHAFAEALRLNPNSPIAMIECANGIVMLEGDKRAAEADRLYAAAAACEAIDAVGRLEVELARAELED
jgi:hypothetical protein